MGRVLDAATGSVYEWSSELLGHDDKDDTADE
jgi:hypothetical protein